MRNSFHKVVTSVLAVLVSLSLLPCGAFAEQDNLKKRVGKQRFTVEQKKAAAEARKRKDYKRRPVTEQGGPVQTAPNSRPNN